MSFLIGCTDQIAVNPNNNQDETIEDVVEEDNEHTFPNYNENTNNPSDEITLYPYAPFDAPFKMETLRVPNNMYGHTLCSIFACCKYKWKTIKS